MADSPMSDFDRCHYRPVISTDGQHLAVIQHDYILKVLRVTAEDSKILCYYTLPKSFHDFSARLTEWKWSPSVEPTQAQLAPTPTLPYLLMSDGSRLVVLNLDALMTSDASIGNVPAGKYVVADFQLGDQFGKLTYVDFMLTEKHVLVMFEMASHASILSLDKPQREDIPNVKFCTEQGLARARDGRSAAIILRVTGQDQIAILTTTDDVVTIQTTFTPHTLDAQGLAWSPNGDPVIAVWDSASHGTRIVFFTAFGHNLKQLEMDPSPSTDSFGGLGISRLQWVQDNHETILAAADGHRKLILRRQQHKAMTVKPLPPLKHPTNIDGAKAIVWQQTSGIEQPFQLEKGIFEATLDQAAGSDATHLSFNCDSSFLASILADNPKTIWLWQPDHPEPHTILVFEQNIRQLLWHPRLPSVLGILTSQKSRNLHFWYSETKPPAPCSLPIVATRLEAQWVGASSAGRHPLLVTAPGVHTVGVLGSHDGIVSFKPLPPPATDFGLADGDSVNEIDTPSRPSRQMAIPAEKPAPVFNRDGRMDQPKW